MLCGKCDDTSVLRIGDTYVLSCDRCCTHNNFDMWLLSESFAGYREGVASYACKGCGTILLEEQLLG